MILGDDSKILYFNDNKLDEKDTQNLYIPSKYKFLMSQITKYQEEFYYYKLVNIQEMTNELIGSALAKKINLETVDYKIGKNEMNSLYLYALSKVFFEKGFLYNDCYDVYNIMSGYYLKSYASFLSYVYLNDSIILGKIENQDTILDILKLTALDLKMGQFDRHNGNILLKIDQNGLIKMAPVFDYGRSYSRVYGTKIYDNPFLILRKNRISLWQFTEKYPEIKEYASFLESISINDILNEIEAEHTIKFSDKKRCYYQERDKSYNKILQKIIR